MVVSQQIQRIPDSPSVLGERDLDGVQAARDDYPQAVGRLPEDPISQRPQAVQGERRRRRHQDAGEQPTPPGQERASHLREPLDGVENIRRWIFWDHFCFFGYIPFSIKSLGAATFF